MSEKKEEITSVSGEPEKDFFVSMLTRDIELHDAVLDLLDNCVDGALRTRSAAAAKNDSLKGFRAEINFSEKGIVIEDNCGGIPWHLAKEYAFKMGKAAEYKRPPGTIGLVGIGMKRAIFKIGRECYVHSHHADDTFMVEIPTEWFTREGWDFDAKREAPRGKGLGTIIEITKPTLDAHLAFRPESDFMNKFPGIVGTSYSYLIDKGFEVSINGKVVPSRSTAIYFEESKAVEAIRPFVFEGVINDVKVFFALGYRTPIKSQEELDADAQGQFRAEEAGWTVVCNDRVVVSNDRTTLTGWGFNGVPSFHNQFSSIAGVVEFQCSDTGKLPLTTTKRGIDAGREVYVLVRQKMQEAMKVFTQNTHRWKGHEVEIKKRFAKTSANDFISLKSKAKTLQLRAITGRPTLYQYKPILPEKQKVITEARISFTRPIAEIKAVSEHLFGEQRDANEVGEACFENHLKKAGR